MEKRVLIIANKNWETAPLMDVLLEPRACPPNFPWPVVLNPLKPWQAGSVKKQASDVADPQPRAIFQFKETVPKPGGKEGKTEECVVMAEVWCLQDWMNPIPSSSSSFEKVNVLKNKIFPWTSGDPTGGKVPDFVVAFGTAGFPTVSVSYNGCVVVGANAFIFNAYPGKSNSDSPWDDSGVKRPITPTLPRSFFDPPTPVIDDALRTSVEPKMIVPPMAPADREILIAAYNYTAVAAVNVTRYDDYAWADPGALAAFKEADSKDPAGSVETTHALIRIQSEAPFLFVSSITDREGAFSSFNMEVTPRVYSQNFACVHNGGVVTAWILPGIARFVAAQA